MFIALASFSLAVGLTACGDDDDAGPDVGSAAGADPAEADDSGATDDSAAAVTVGDGDGDGSNAVAADLPESFPTWAVYLPEGLELQQSQEREAAGRPNWIVVGNVDRDPGSVEFELLGHYGDPVEAATPADSITMSFDRNGYLVDFTLQENADGGSLVSVSVIEQ